MIYKHYYLHLFFLTVIITIVIHILIAMYYYYIYYYIYIYTQAYHHSISNRISVPINSIGQVTRCRRQTSSSWVRSTKPRRLSGRWVELASRCTWIMLRRDEYDTPGMGWFLGDACGDQCCGDQNNMVRLCENCQQKYGECSKDSGENNEWASVCVCSNIGHTFWFKRTCLTGRPLE